MVANKRKTDPQRSKTIVNISCFLICQSVIGLKFLKKQKVNVSYLADSTLTKNFLWRHFLEPQLSNRGPGTTRHCYLSFNDVSQRCLCKVNCTSVPFAPDDKPAWNYDRRHDFCHEQKFRWNPRRNDDAKLRREMAAKNSQDEMHRTCRTYVKSQLREHFASSDVIKIV